MSKIPPSRVYLLDKPPGISSFAALGELKRRIGTKKVGHAGTLDPFASGLLIALSGKMTRAAFLAEGLPKEYEAIFRFGEETDTLDTEGKVIAAAAVPEYETIADAASLFRGEIKQVPPVYSAIKVKGKRAYQSARQGQTVELPPRGVFIHTFEILSWQPPDLAVRIKCSKGTYIRSIARDMGIACGSRAHCLRLCRTAIDPFRVDEAAENGIAPRDFFHRIGIVEYSADSKTASALREGKPPEETTVHYPPLAEILFVTDEHGEETALLTRQNGHWRYRIVF
ncbi:MAG: tRNA pseudouridine(55) synthase TruB [Spirochaeta sp. LUC14_002_19_P3]|nr:MAG: tRNA pseudouridine(55) synthase TruB [Spirochaeta sp. LUC14_002_19_P3]